MAHFPVGVKKKVKKSYVKNNFQLHNNIVFVLIICTTQDRYQMGIGGMGVWGSAYFFGRENQINPREKFSIFGRENELRP